MNDVVIFREGEGTDIPLIYSTWRNAEWFSTDQSMNSNEFFRKATKNIKEILKKSKVKIACLKNDRDFILGYSVMNKEKLEFVYVKSDYRKKGIARVLTKGFKTWSEAKTEIGRAIEKRLSFDYRSKSDDNQHLEVNGS